MRLVVKTIKDDEVASERVEHTEFGPDDELRVTMSSGIDSRGRFYARLEVATGRAKSSAATTGEEPPR